MGSELSEGNSEVRDTTHAQGDDTGGEIAFGGPYVRGQGPMGEFGLVVGGGALVANPPTLFQIN
jgi:hypothetical protein